MEVREYADLKVRLLGPFEIRNAERVLAPLARKAQILIARLAISPDQRMDRESLATFLWPEVNPSASRASLRQALARLRTALGDFSAALIVDAGAVALDPAHISFDIDLEGFPNDENLSRVGEFLEGLHVPEPSLQEWLEVERRHIAENIRSRFELVLSQDHDSKTRITLGMRRVALDPFNEAAHRDLMIAFSRDRRRAQALQQFRTLEKLLEVELGVSPEDESRELYLQIKNGTTHPEHSLPVIRESEVDESIDSLRFMVIVRCSELQQNSITLDKLSEVEASGGRVLAENTVLFGYEQVHEKDAVNAVGLAWKLRGILKHSGIGITAGLVSVESERIIGSSARDADRLAFVAEATEVLVSEAVRTLTMTMAKFEAVEIRRQRCWRVTDLLEVPLSRDVPFIGRLVETAQLDALIGATKTGQGCAALLSGGPGMGKTRLSDELANTAKSQNMSVVRAGFSPVRGELLAFEMRLGTAVGRCIESLPDQPTTEGALVQCLIDQFVGQPGDASARSRLSMIDRTQYTELVVSALTCMMESSAENFLVIIEDCHWAVDDELQVLIALSAAISSMPIMLLLTERPEEEMLRPKLLSASMETPVTVMTLSGLRESEARTLVRSIPGASDEAATRICQQAAGNPLFIIRLAEAGELSGELPASVLALAQQQLDRMNEDARTACQCASVLGHQFKRIVFTEIFTQPSIEHLIGSGFFQITGDSVTFVHALIHEAIYQTISEHDKQRLHLLAAKYFEAQDLIAWAEHALASADGSLAARACAAAANMVLPQNRFDLGEKFIEAGLAAGGTPEERAVLLLCRGTARRENGMLHDALEIYHAALNTTDDRDMQIQISIRLAWVYDYNNETEKAEQMISQADALAEADSISDVTRCELLSAHGRRSYFNGRYEECLALQRQAHELAESAGLTLQRLRALGGMAEAYYCGFRLESAAKCNRACIEEADRLGLAIVANRHRHMHSYASNMLLPGPQSRQLAEMSVERTRLESSRRNELAARIDMLEFYSHNAEREAGLNEIEAIDSMIDTMTGNSWLSEYDVSRSIFAFYAGDRERVAEIAKVHLSPPLDPYLGPTFTALMAWAEGPGTECDRLLKQGEVIFVETRISHTVFHFHHFAARAVIDQPERALGYQHRMIELAGNEPVGVCALSLAAMKHLIGQPDRSLEQLRQDLQHANLRAFLPGT